VSALTQWAIVAAIVVLCAAYALKVLLPKAARFAIARKFRAWGRPELAEQLEGGSGCDACASNPARRPTESNHTR
jgi:hypothetical protein